MGYSKKEWMKRYAERSDISTQLIHLTRKNPDIGDAVVVLLRILQERKLRGSTRQSGFIVGDRRAVCFQDTPIVSLCQNLYYEQKFREAHEAGKLRYQPIGVAFSKHYAFQKGARPAIYDRTAEAKKYLPPELWWRIVNLDLVDQENIVDWTHEREWRSSEDFEFELKYTFVLLSNETAYHRFIVQSKSLDANFLEKLAGIVVLSGVFR